MKKTMLIALMIFVATNYSWADAPTDTDGDGYLNVSTLDHLKWISENSSSWKDKFELDNDIDASATSGWNNGAGFLPIGNDNNKFEGQFNGNGHTISNLYIKRSNLSHIGLFGYVYEATIENIGIVNCNITGYSHVGGLVGRNYNSTISNSYSTGEVSGNNEVGGLVGCNAHGSTISNSYSTGAVSGIWDVGGLVGCNAHGSTISDSYSTGEVSGTGDTVGGFIGWNAHGSTISDSYSTGEVSGNNEVGGLVGSNNGMFGSSPSKISNSYSRGTVTRKSGSVGADFGGFCGSNDATIEYCYSTGSVIYTGDNPTDKGFVGSSSGSPTYQHNFFDSDVSNQSTCTGATPTTTENMQKQSTFTNWKFGQNENWTMDPDLNEGYPAHQWADNSGASVASFSPEDEATDIELDADLVITFDESVAKGAGNITLYKSDGTVFETLAVTDVTIEGNQVTINPSSDLEELTNYYVQIDADCFKDASGNDYAGIDNNATWNFKTEDTAPIVSAFSPENEATDIELDADLVITFDETVAKGSGNITLYKFDGTLIETIDVKSGKVSVNGMVATINPANNLESLTGYYVKIGAGCFKDVSNNSYAGITDNTTWTFKAKFEAINFQPATGTALADIGFSARPTIDANKTINFIGFQLASNYEMTQNITELEDEDAAEKGYILLNWNNYTYGQMYYYRYAVRYTDGTEDYGPVSAFIRNEGTGVIEIGN